MIKLPIEWGAKQALLIYSRRLSVFLLMVMLNFVFLCILYYLSNS